MRSLRHWKTFSEGFRSGGSGRFNLCNKVPSRCPTSPGPAILAIIATSVSQGRKAGLSLVFGRATAENIVTTTKCLFHRKEKRA